MTGLVSLGPAACSSRPTAGRRPLWLGIGSWQRSWFSVASVVCPRTLASSCSPGHCRQNHHMASVLVTTVSCRFLVLSVCMSMTCCAVMQAQSGTKH